MSYTEKAIQIAQAIQLATSYLPGEEAKIVTISAAEHAQEQLFFGPKLMI